MLNGRCRFHGGLSTGPRTPGGLERSQKATLKHGQRSAEVLAASRLRGEARRVLRDLELMTRSAERVVDTVGSSPDHGPLRPSD